MNFFRELSNSACFPICYNLLPHFAGQGQEYSALIKRLEEVLADGRIHTFFLSDRPARRQPFSSLQLAKDILAAGGEPVVSLALTSTDRNAAVDKLQRYYQVGVRQFLFVSGDYPQESDNFAAKPVFDIDSVQLFMLAAELQESEKFVAGCVVSPFKTFESEQIWQYEKLRRKISLGADFIVTQLGYDMRKFDELIQFCRLHKITVPLVANIFITDMQTARMIQARVIPGVKMPGPLLRLLHEEPASQQGAITRTAKIMAVVNGLGYNGALLGTGAANFREVQQVLDQAETFQADWQNHLDQLNFAGSTTPFYYFQKNTSNGLNNRETAPVALKHFPSPTYTLSFFVDWLVYVPQGPLFKLTGKFCFFCHTRKYWYGFLWLLEYITKGILYGCKMCGDCTLYACGFLCYQSGCPKKMLNGPCGGSIDGYCEVFPEKKRCHWVKVYHHMKGVRQHVTFVAPPIPPKNNALNRTSSWINFFLGKDHRQLRFKDS